MTAEQIPEPLAPWVRGYIQNVYAVLEEGIDGVTRMRAHMGEDWDPIPSYEFHLALAKSRLASLSPEPVAPPCSGGGVPSTHTGTSTGPAPLPEQRGATP